MAAEGGSGRRGQEGVGKKGGRQRSQPQDMAYSKLQLQEVGLHLKGGSALERLRQ